MDKLKQHHWRARYDATQGLARIGWKAMGAKAARVEKALLWRLQKDKNFWVRQGAARAFGALGQRGILALVQVMLHDAKAEVRNEAAKALGAIAKRGRQPLMGGHQLKVQAALRKARKDKAIRWTAAQAWEHLTGNPQPLIDVMLLDLRSRNSRVKGIVARSFGRLSTRARAIATRALLDVVAQSPSARSSHRYIVDALQAIGKVALPALRQASKHKQPAVRAVARQAIQRIGQATP